MMLKQDLEKDETVKKCETFFDVLTAHCYFTMTFFWGVGGSALKDCCGY
jgi:hypothetical protein